MSQIYKKCEIVGCIRLAHRKPMLSIAMQIKKTGNWISPYLILFEGVCPEHHSSDSNDYLDRKHFDRINWECKRRGWLPHWDLMKIRYMPMDWKPGHGGRMHINQVLAEKGDKLIWLPGQDRLRKSN